MIGSGDEYKDATIPLLQAVAVFLKPKERDLKQTITGKFPKITTTSLGKILTYESGIFLTFRIEVPLNF